MFRKYLLIGGFFALFFLPVLALSFWAYTVAHQVILSLAAVVSLWAAFHISHLARERARLRREVFSQACDLEKAQEALQSCLANVQETRAYNQRLLQARLKEECDRARRYGRPLSFLMIEIDSLESIQNLYGPEVAGALIQEFSGFLKANTRSVDIMIREGENRIVSILPETSWERTRTAAERICYAAGKNSFKVSGHSIQATVSAGFLTFDGASETSNEKILSCLERALTSAQKTGGGKVATLAAEKGQ